MSHLSKVQSKLGSIKQNYGLKSLRNSMSSYGKDEPNRLAEIASSVS